jgi:hypothetical protein
VAEGEGRLRSEELLELLGSQSGSFGDATHRIGIDRIGARDCNPGDPIRHNDMPALPNDFKSSFLQRPNSLEMRDTWNAWHNSDSDLDFAYVRSDECFLSSFQIFLYGDLNVLDGFLFCIAL